MLNLTETIQSLADRRGSFRVRPQLHALRDAMAIPTAPNGFVACRAVLALKEAESCADAEVIRACEAVFASCVPELPLDLEDDGCHAPST